MFGISPAQLIIILVIVLLLFGTKKLRSLGGDLGSAVKGFKKAISDEDKDKDEDADFVTKQNVEDKSSKTAENSTQNKTSEQKEHN